MSTTATPTATDRSDFRTVVIGGTKIGALTGAAVVGFLLVSRFAPAGTVREVLQALVVLAAAPAVSLLPGHWVTARRTEGIAGAAAMGLWGTVVFMAIDIILLRPFKAYPWTWDAVGGGSTWWYVPIWWMLGTFAAWMGGMLTAARASRGGGGGEVTVARLATPVLAGAVALTAAAKIAGLDAALPVATGAGYTITLAVLAVAGLRGKA